MPTQQLRQPWDGVAPTGPIMRVADAAHYLGLSVTRYYELAQARSPGELAVVPTPLKIGPRAAGIPKPWLDAIVADRAARAMGDAS